MSTVFSWMVAGLLVTGATAYYAATSGWYLSLMQGMGFWLVILAPFAFLLVMNFGLQKLSVSALALCFLAFAGTMGVSLGGIFFAYSLGSLAQVFAIAAGTFAIMAIAGYTTKVDLSKFGSILFMGLLGIILATGLVVADAIVVVEAVSARIEPLSWDDAESLMDQKMLPLIINTSSRGMKGENPITCALAAQTRETVVNDIVYNPLQTALLQSAEGRGCRTVDGLGMLLHQARPAFQAFFGGRVVVDAGLRHKVERHMGLV